MKFHTRMPRTLRSFYKKELQQYTIFLDGKDYQAAWRQLERAHILGQAYPVAHTEVHWLMLRFGIRMKNYQEIIGQLPRLLVGGVKSFVGKIPVGNTGGANVPPLRAMEIPEDLQRILKQQRKQEVC